MHAIVPIHGLRNLILYWWIPVHWIVQGLEVADARFLSVCFCVHASVQVLLRRQLYRIQVILVPLWPVLAHVR